MDITLDAYTCGVPSCAIRLYVMENGASVEIAVVGNDGIVGIAPFMDRAGLEARVCECYAVVKKEFDRLLPAARGD
jgi:hypothetical protein